MTSAPASMARAQAASTSSQYVAMIVLAPPRVSGDPAPAPASALSSVSITIESPIRISVWISSPFGPRNRS